MIKITKVEYAGAYCLKLTFDDGAEGVIDIAEQVTFEGVFKPMKNIEFFKRVHINRTWGTIEWPGRIDFDSETLHEEIIGRSIERPLTYAEAVEA